MCAQETPDCPDLSRYAGRWVALLNGRVVGVGETGREAFQAARGSRPREEPTAVIYVNPAGTAESTTPDSLAGLFGLDTLAGQVRDLLRMATDQAFLVGGSVRDFLAGRICHDLDLAVAGNALDIGRWVADQLAAAYFPVDSERGVARIVMREVENGDPTHIDIAALRDGVIEADLSGRDFHHQCHGN